MFVFKHCFRSMIIPFLIMLQVMFFAKLPMNHLCNFVVPPMFILFLCEILVLINNMSKSFFVIAANSAKRGNIDFINTMLDNLVLIACSWAAMRVPSVAFLRSPFLTQFQLLGSLNSVALKIIHFEAYFL